MNIKGEHIKKDIKAFEGKFLESVNSDKWRLGYHLMPPTGWINDPNGLCYFHGKYHVFFQHNAMNPEGGKKSWGHYVGKSLIDWKYESDAIVPDTSFDSHGAYSGSTLVWNDKMYIFYSANHKEHGDYDFIHDGRTNDVVIIVSEDGMNFSDKQIVISWEDYPEGYTRHIRDPKVWEENGQFFMLLGARTMDDIGVCLLYTSGDLYNWEFIRRIDTTEYMGYMWECPEYFSVGRNKFIESETAHILSACPQGLEHQAFRFQNNYQSGYFLLPRKITDNIRKCGNTEFDFHEWDKGFDFYAPQTFEDETERRILIAWAGLPDDPYFNPTIEKGWQGALTFPREITYVDGKVRANPVEELKTLRELNINLENDSPVLLENGLGELIISVPEGENLDNNSSISIADYLVITYKDMIFSMDFTNCMGCGRTIRKEVIGSIRNIRVLIDTSLVEVFINDGEQVFTTRYYPQNIGFEVDVSCGEADKTLWKLRKMEVQY